jgi:hypothetical protein
MSPLEDWVAALANELGVDGDIDVRLLLEVARDAAHHVERPAAPLTTFLVGYAAGRNADQAGAVAVAEAAARAQALALGWPASTQPPGP